MKQYVGIQAELPLRISGFLPNIDVLDALDRT